MSTNPYEAPDRVDGNEPIAQASDRGVMLLASLIVVFSLCGIAAYRAYITIDSQTVSPTPPPTIEPSSEIREGSQDGQRD